jgi:hypothetical protein
MNIIQGIARSEADSVVNREVKKKTMIRKISSLSPLLRGFILLRPVQIKVVYYQQFSDPSSLIASSIDYPGLASPGKG